VDGIWSTKFFIGNPELGCGLGNPAIHISQNDPGVLKKIGDRTELFIVGRA